MTAVYPTSQPTFTNFNGTETLGTPVGGKELWEHINQLQEELAALLLDAGISESSPQDTPVANTVLQSLTNGKRKWATIVTAMMAANAVTQIQSGAVSGTTTSATLVDATGTITLTSTGGPILALLMSSSFSTVIADNGSITVQIDGVDKSIVGMGSLSNAIAIPAAAIGLATPASGSRVIKARFRRDGGSGTINFSGTLVAVEFKR